MTDTGWMWDNVDRDVSLASAMDELGLRRSPKQLSMLEAFRARYRKTGLLPDRNPPLWECCANAARCWKQLDDGLKRTDRGGATLPWIGAEFHRTRVALLAHNLREAGGLLVEMKVAGEVRDTLMGGGSKPHGSWFAFRSMQAVAAVIASARGEKPKEALPTPESLIEPLDSCARFQAVKCSPFDGGDSRPSDAMESLCPDDYLLDDLRLARPGTLIVLGAPARRAVTRLFDGEWVETPGMTHGSVAVDSNQLDVFCLAHPSARRGEWDRSWERFIAVLGSSRD
jgi:hypothetical protein